MARVEITEIVTGRDAQGVLYGLNGASVQVNVRGGAATTVYSAATGGTTLTNPLTSVNGRISGYVDEGSYDLVVTYLGVVSADVLKFEARAAYPTGTTGQVLAKASGGGVEFVDQSSSSAPWRHDINVFTTPSTQTNWSTITVASTYILNGHLASSGVQNDAIGWDVVLAAGTWTLSLVAPKNTSLGIITASLDGVSLGTTIDLYAAALTVNNLLTIAGTTVATTGKKRLLLTMATKNASATAYSGSLQALSLIRTA